MLNVEALVRIGKQSGAEASRVEAAVGLLEGGATVPFIARYRKEATGNLDEAQLRDIDEQRRYYTGLDERRQTVLATIERQGKLTPELREQILACFVKNELEDIYLSYKPRRRTRAQSAIERGLGPLADYIWEQTGEEPVEVYAQKFITAAPPPAPVAVPESAPDAVEAAPVSSQAEETDGSAATPADPAADAAAGTEAAAAADQEQAVPDALAGVEPAPSAMESPAEPVSATAPAEAAEAADGAPAPHEIVLAAYDILTGAVMAPEAAALETAEPAASESPTAPLAAAIAAPAAAANRPPDRSVRSAEEAVNGAIDILAERIAENPAYRKRLRDRLWSDGVVRARALPGKESAKTKYEMYYKFEETAVKLPSHRMLAIRRGSRENVLSYTIEGDRDGFIAGMLAEIVKIPGSSFVPYLGLAARDGYDRLMAPSIQNEVRSGLRERAEAEANRVFEENLRALLLSPPAGPIAVMGVDPGLKSGCKLAVVDPAGKFAENQLIRLAEPDPDTEGAERILLDLAARHGIRGIAIGNGTGSREAETFIRAAIQKHALDVFVVVLNEAGASIYSASKRARDEFPNLEVAVRSAISIARRLQDPLAELVKIEPRSIGVGQYQHDVDQKKLKHSLALAMESCVNRVGVDLNTASADLLKYVSGIGEKIAAGIVAYREKNGLLRSRTQLREIEGLAEKSFEQAAGFLRIKGGDHPLDATAVHPESYGLVERMAQSIDTPLTDLVANVDRVRTIDFKTFEADAGRFTLNDIREELFRPGRDPRERFAVPKFREDVKELADLKEGMELEGAVTNVTNFGAFVDLGVHQDGLVHISELSHTYIQDAREGAKVGDVVKVKVIAVDLNLKRISLSIKALLPKPPRPQPRIRSAPQPAAAATAAAGAPGGETPPSRPGPRKPNTDRPNTGRPGGPAPRAGAPSSAARQGSGPRPDRRPERPADRPSNQERREPRPAMKPQHETTSAAPAVAPAAPSAPQTMEEKIRQLQQKFGRVV